MRIQEVIELSNGVAARCWRVAESTPGSQKLGYIAKELGGLLETLRSARVVDQGSELPRILENIREELLKGRSLLERISAMSFAYKVISGYQISCAFTDVCQGLGIALNGLQGFLSAFQNFEIAKLTAQVTKLEHNLRNTKIEAERSHVYLFTESRRIASQIYNKKLSICEGTKALRSIVENVIGTTQSRDEWEKVAKELFYDMQNARKQKDKVEEHYFKQMMQALKSEDRAMEIPNEFLCPISLEVMEDPVVLVETAVTFDKKSIDTWLYAYGQNTCPVSRKVLIEPRYVENRFAKMLISDWLKTHKANERVPSRSLNPFHTLPQESFGYVPSASLFNIPGYGTQSLPNSHSRSPSITGSTYSSADTCRIPSAQGSICNPGPSDPSPTNPLYTHRRDGPSNSRDDGTTSRESSRLRQPFSVSTAAHEDDFHSIFKSSTSSLDLADQVPMQFQVSSQSRNSSCRTPKIPSADILEAIHAAAQTGDITKMACMSAQGFNLDQEDDRGRTSVHIAAACESSNMVKYLLSNGCRVDTETRVDKATPLYVAAAAGQLSTLKVLLDRKADIMKSTLAGWTPLHVAADEGHPEIVKALLEHAHKNGLCMYMAMTTRAGWTPLHHAARSGREELVEQLSYFPHLKDKACNVGFTALHIAVDNGHVGVTRALLEAGVDVNICSREGWTALHVAQDQNNIEIGRLLISKGAKVDIAGDGGLTALHRSTIHNHLEFAKLLVTEGGANLKLKTKPTGGHGRKAIQIAADHNHDMLYTFLFRASIKRLFSARKIT